MHRTDLTPNTHRSNAGADHGQITALGRAIAQHGLPFVMLGGLAGMPIKLTPVPSTTTAANG